MKRLSEYRGEEALDVLADLIEPTIEIMQDKRIAELFRNGEKAKAIAVAIREHKRSVIDIMATLDGESRETYAPGLLTLPAKILEMLNDPELVNLFTSQGQKEPQTDSGSATANIAVVRK